MTTAVLVGGRRGGAWGGAEGLAQLGWEVGESARMTVISRQECALDGLRSLDATLIPARWL